MAETFRGSIENFKTTKEPPPWDHYKTNSDSSSLQFHGLNAKVHLNGSTVLNGERLAQPVDLYAKVLSMRLSDTETMVFLQMGETRENARNAMITIASPASSKAEAKK